MKQEAKNAASSRRLLALLVSLVGVAAFLQPACDEGDGARDDGAPAGSAGSAVAGGGGAGSIGGMVTAGRAGTTGVAGLGGLGGAGAGGVVSPLGGWMGLGGAGKGGTAAGGVAGQAGSRDEWMDDPSVWTKVPDSGECPQLYTDSSKAKFRMRTWSECGQGCLKSPAGQYESGMAGLSVLHGKHENKATIFRIESLVNKSLGSALFVETLETGQTHLAVTAEAKCGFYSLAERSPDVFALARSGSLSGVKLGRWDPAVEGQLRWRQDWLEEFGFIQFVTTVQGGYMVSYTDGKVRFLLDTANDYQVVDSNAVAPYRAQSRGDFTIWHGFESSVAFTLLKGHSPKEGTKVLYHHPDSHELADVAMSDVHMVWAAGQWLGDAYGDIRLEWSPVAKDPSGVSVTTSGYLPYHCGASSLQTWGDYAAVVGCVELVGAIAKRELLVLQLSTQKMWRFADKSGLRFMSVLAVTPTELLLSKLDSKGQHVDYLYRFELSKLDALLDAW